MLACPTFQLQLLSASIAQAGTPTHTHAEAYTGSELFFEPLLIVLSMSRFGVSRPDF